MAALFKENVGSTFSDLWYRVGPLRPRPSPHTHTIRQQTGSRVSYIIEDPAGGQYYRLSPAAHFFLGLLDGRRTVNEAWDACNAQLGDAAPTQRECVDLLSKLQLFGLLTGDAPLAADMVLERKRQIRSKRTLKRTGRWMAFSLPLVNPEPFLERYSHICRALFSRWGMILWTATVLAALWAVIVNAGRFGNEFGAELLDPANLLWMSALFMLLRAVHELGHAAACKAVGGRPTEIGLLLIAGVLPVPYCDATSAWRLPDVWPRVLVSSAGIIAETCLAAAAAFIWAATETGRVHALAYNVMIVSGLTTLLFNANPLLRYDGYYILSDIAGVPNLAQKAREAWVYLVERFAFGLQNIKPPVVRSRAEAALLLVYGSLSLPYRVLITVSILLLVSTMYLSVGVVLAAILGAVWLVGPLLKGVGYLAGSPKLLGRRARAVGVVSAVVALLAVGLGVIPAPAAGYASAILQPKHESGLRAAEQGFVAALHAKIGDPVAAGQTIVELRNPELQTEKLAAEAQLRRALAELDQAAVKSPADRKVAQMRVAHARENLARLQARVDELTIRAPISGRLAAAGGTGLYFENAVGRFVPRGALLAAVVSDGPPVVRALVPDRERGYIFRSDADAEAGWPRATVRIRGNAGEELTATLLRIVPAGSRDQADRALFTASGGDVLPDPEDREGRRTLIPYFVVELEAEDLPENIRPGVRARVRFGVPPEPLAAQWWRKVRQFISVRLPT